MRRALMLLMATLTLAACGPSDGDALDWSRTDDPVGAASGLVWADARTGDVHLSDGTTLSTDRSISSFVVAGKGAYVVDKKDGALVEVTAGGARRTGAFVDTRAKASPDGHYIAFIDPKAGPKVEADVHVLTSVVVDLRTGKEVFRSSRGMGDPDKDDLPVLYESADYGVLAVTDRTAWISVPDGDVLAIDLSSGKVTQTPDTDTANGKNPWVGPRFAPEPVAGPANPSGTWGIDHVRKKAPSLSSDPAFVISRDVLNSPEGTVVVPRPDAVAWRFEQWIDDATVVGFANDNLTDPGLVKKVEQRSLLTCTVPDGDCAIVPDSEHAILPEPSLY